MSIKKQPQAGFTIVEVLIGIALFAMFIAAVSYTLLQNIQVNSSSREKLSSNMNTQQIAETVKDSWRNSDDYAKGCITGLVLPSNVQLTSQSMAAYVDSTPVAPVTGTSATPVLACTSSSVASAPVPTMRRVFLITTTGSQQTQVTFDVLNPGAY